MNYRADGKAVMLDATTPAKVEAAPLAASVIAAGKLEVSAEKRKLNLHPLASLAPYVKRYRWRAISRCGAFILAALMTLIVPIAVRLIGGQRALDGSFLKPTTLRLPDE